MNKHKPINSFFSLKIKATIMNELSTSQHWRELQTKLKAKYPELTDTDLAYEDTMEQDMLRMVEYKLGKSKEEMQKIIILL